MTTTTPKITEAGRIPGTMSRVIGTLTGNQESVIIAALVILLIGITLVNPLFLDAQNLLDIVSNTAYIGIAAIGVTMIIISGNIDISPGATLTVCSVVAGTLAKWTVENGQPIWIAFAVTILVGGLVGLVNGLLVAYARIPAIVVTLGTASILKGGLILITQGRWVYYLPDNWFLARRDLLGIPIPIVVMLILVGIFWFWMRYTVAGREIYAVGGNADAARLSGISTPKVLMRIFVMSGLLIGVAAVVYATKFDSVQSNITSGYELTVITAAVIGGVSILGGTGSVIGAFLGGILLQAISTALVFLHIRAEWFLTVQGSLILGTILIDVLRRRRVK